MSESSTNESFDMPLVRHFRQVLFWPLQLEIEASEDRQIRPWTELQRPGSPWRQLGCDITMDLSGSRESRYKEFVSFLPYVQRFLYGEGQVRPRPGNPPSPASMQILRREDIKQLRIVLKPGDEPKLLKVVHVDLHFFFDMDVALLKVELEANDLPWCEALDLLHRFGRAYPSGWDQDGRGLHNADKAEWLDGQGQVLAQSDTSDREKYLSFVCAHRVPAVASHWAYLLQPMVLEYAEGAGTVRFRQLEYNRMPVMAYLAMENPRQLSAEDFIRLGFITQFKPEDPLPKRFDGERGFFGDYCDDRYWANTSEGPNTRIICTGNTLMVVGESSSEYFCDPVLGFLGQFRHQFVLTFLIAHFHRAALLSFSDRLVDAINDLDLADLSSQRRFRKSIRIEFASFLRFTHRYWFQEISERAQLQSLFRRCSAHLGNEAQYHAVKDEMRDMNQYLDGEEQRRQSNTVVRLTVVTTFGLIGALVTGFFGMNLIDETETELWLRVAYATIAMAVASGLVLFTVSKSKALSDFLEALSEHRKNWKGPFPKNRRR